MTNISTQKTKRPLNLGLAWRHGDDGTKISDKRPWLAVYKPQATPFSPRSLKQSLQLSAEMETGPTTAAAAPASAPSLPIPPGGPIEIIFSFDITSSMSEVINTVKERVSELIQRLLADLPGIRIGIMAHSDYDDDEDRLLQRMDFSSNADALIDFVRNVKSARVCNDLPEFYELVLQQLRLTYSWTPGYQKRVVMIGDAEPHEKFARKNKPQLEWRKEALALKEELGVSIYSVKAGDFRTEYFWRSIAEVTDGVYLQLSEMRNIFDFLVAICYQEYGPDVFAPVEREIQERVAPHPELRQMLETLKTTKPALGADEEMEEAAPMTTRKRKASPETWNLEVKRVRREEEALEARGQDLELQSKFSTWKPLARPVTPSEALPAGWRRFGHGAMPTKMTAVIAEGRVLIEVGVQRPGEAAPTVLFARIAELRPGGDLARLLLRRSGALQWHMDRSLARGQSLLFRTAALTRMPGVRAQRLALKRNASYAWNSGRPVPERNGGRGPLLAARPPRERQMALFRRRFKALSKARAAAAC